MAFTELNSVEYYVIHQLSGVNLNKSGVAEPSVAVGRSWNGTLPGYSVQIGVSEQSATKMFALIARNDDFKKNRIYASEQQGPATEHKQH